ncbi:MAG TPA: VOC family protein [Chthoniobacterales bacterium]|jgi:predicted 3-demethylubiquinone-9 3-methyltransferase (glyoxalase superfamily)|nr:VOC family protein [Chthoniobacterales bacterium]
MQKITPFLWFDSNAEEAVAFYLSVFKDGKLLATTRYPEEWAAAGRHGNDDGGFPSACGKRRDKGALGIILSA